VLDDQATLLTAFQVEIAQLFFNLPASDGFLLAGGGALLAHGLITRPTVDLDFFAGPEVGGVSRARDELTMVAVQHGWTVDLMRDSDTFCRLTVHGAEELGVDLAVDAVRLKPATASIVGPTLAPIELAGQKVAALFNRAALRDFADVWTLSQRFGKAALLEFAQEIDAGFDLGVFAEMIGSLGLRADSRLAAAGVADVGALREFFRQWRVELIEASSTAGSAQALGGD
jgi:hypothetical protein